MSSVKSYHFQFKQFAVAHDRCAMKVGTDGVVLGAWVSVENTTSILDVGTGSGVIALMLAQRTSEKTLIDAIEINEPDAQQASENVLNSPWKERVQIHHSALQQFHTEKKFDLIVSNPPFFNHSLPPSAGRAAARHTQTLSFYDFLKHATSLLQPNGKLAVILPFQEGLEFRTMAEQQFQLFINRSLALFSKKEKKQERWVFELSPLFTTLQEEHLYIHDQHDWSKEYRTLTKEFYLHF